MKEPIIKKVKNWIDERTGLVTFVTVSLHEEIPGGTKFSYTLGSACMFLLSIQIITGIWSLFYYVPTVDYAYSSLNYMRLEVPFGWLIHGFHKWGGTLFTIVVGLHALRVFVWGSYKKPREMVWLIGIFLILLTALFMFTGPVLPWDKKGYWAGQVGIGIAGSVPFVGPFTQMLLQGANEMGQSALLRMYVLHVALLPGAIALFVVLHLIAFRQYGESGPWKAEERKKIGYFWPEQIFKDVIVAFLLFLLLIFLSAFYPPEFSGLADPADTLYTPKPEWNFLFLYQLLKILPGPLEPLGTAGVPLMIVLLFASLPFLDKGPEKSPFKRGFVILSGFALVAVILFLTYLGAIYRSPAEVAEMDSKETSSMPLINTRVEREKVIHQLNVDENVTGEKLFKTLGCTECHTATGEVSNKQGPDLAIAHKNNNRSSVWLHDQIIAPEGHNQKTIMPPYSHLSKKNVNLLVAYLEGLEPKQPPPVEAPPVAAVVTEEGKSQDNAVVGEQLFNAQGCAQCHTIVGKKSFKAGPDLVLAMIKDKPSKDWLKTQLIAPSQHNPLTIMPSYATRMKDAEINAVVDFLNSLSTKVVEPATQEEANQQVTIPSVPKGIGTAVDIVGDKEHGAILFHKTCMSCHGPHGNPEAPGFNAPKGVPSLNPIRYELTSSNVRAFTQRIDVFIQHGAPALTEGGPLMSDFGDSHALTQAQIADLEAYILALNGVDRTQVINPGIEPKEFFWIVLGVSIVVVLLSGLYWFILRSLKI